MLPTKTGHIFPFGLLTHLVIVFCLLLYFLNYFFDLADQVVFVTLLLGVLFTCVMVLRYKRFILYTLAFVVPLSMPFPILENSNISMPAELICLLLTAFFIAKLVLGHPLSKRFLYHPITICILLDLSWFFVSSCFSEMPQVSFKRLIIRLFYYCSFYYFYFELFTLDTKNIRRVFLLHVFGFILPIVYAVFKHAQYKFTTMGAAQIAAPFYFDHTIYGACLALFIPFLIAQTLNSSSKKNKLMYGLLSLVFCIAVFLSYSRAAWLSLIIAAGIYLLIKYRVRLRYLLLALVLIIVTSVLNWQRVNTFLEKNKQQSHSNDIGTHLKSISNINTDVSNRERINRWKCALRMFADKPLFGFGPGTYQFFYGQYQQRSDLTRISTFSGNKGHAHSEYLNYLSETGAMGLLIFLALITTVSLKCIRLIQSGEDVGIRTTAAYLFIGLTTFMIHGLFNGFIEFDKVAMPVFSSFAAITCLDLNRSEALSKKINTPHN